MLPALLTCLLLAFAALPASAQSNSSIVGVVSDPSGAAVAGVTVAISGPSLLASRSTVSDSGGRYRIVDLRPGTYTLIFNGAGFRSLKRENIDLPATFTATVDGVLQVGETKEEVTVTTAAPLIDVQDSQTETVMDREKMDALPTGHDIFADGQIIPGVTTSTPDVAGTGGMQQPTLQVHGSASNDNVFLVDGMWIQHVAFSGNQTGAYFNDNLMQSIVYTVDTLPVEAPVGGIQINMVPKIGGNQFHGSIFATGSTSALQANNLTPALVNQGMTIQNRVDALYDFDSGAGGPILKDRLWFYGSFRRWGATNYLGNTYLPSGAQGIDDNRLTDIALRLTGQLSKNQRLTVSYDRGFKFRGHRPNNYIGANISGQEADVVQKSWMNYISQIKYTFTPTSKLLFEAGATEMPVNYNLGPEPGVPDGTIALYDVGNSTMTRSSPRFDNDRGTMNSYMAAATYVTGKHTFKTGLQARTGYFQEAFTVPGNIIQVYNFGVPFEVYLTNTPLAHREKLAIEAGVYAEDTWKISRHITLNPGLRFDHMDMSIPAQGSAGNQWTGPIAEASHPDLVDWNTFSPRLGVAWDVFGDSKTAIRGGVSKYDRLEGTTLAQNVNQNYISRNVCPWTSPILPTTLAQVTGIGCTGFPNVTAQIDPHMKRPYQMEYTVSIQRQIGARTAVSAGYYHRQFYDLYGIENQAVPSTAYTSASITNPITGQPLTVYNELPSYIGKNLTYQTTLPFLTQHYNGVEFTGSTRFSRGSLFGGLTIGKDYGIPDGSSSSADYNNPNTLTNLAGNFGYDAPIQIRAGGNYTAWKKIQVSGTLRENSGLPQSRSLSLTKAIDPGLTQSQSILVASPGTYRYPWQNLVDLRLSRSFSLFKDHLQFEPVADLFNVFNSSAITSQSTTINATNSNKLTPSAIDSGFVSRFGGKITF